MLFHGAPRNPETLRNLGMSDLLELVQHEHSTTLLRQILERYRDSIEPLFRVDRGFRLRKIGGGLRWNTDTVCVAPVSLAQSSALAIPPEVPGEIYRGPVDVCWGAVHGTCVGRTLEPEEEFLKDVLGVLLASEPCSKQPLEGATPRNKRVRQ